jgi:hypothetical protein
MRFSIRSLMPAFALLSTTSARIYGLRAPVTIKAGEPFQVSLLTQGYIQSVYDVATAFGIAPGTGHSQSLGTIIGSEYIGLDGSNTYDTLNFTVSAPASTVEGNYTLTTSVMSLYGDSSGPILSSWNVSVTVGWATSTKTVDSSS